VTYSHRVLAIVLIALACPLVSAQESKLTDNQREAKIRELNKKDQPYFVRFEPRSERSEVFIPVVNAKNTGMVPCSFVSGNLIPYSRKDFRKLKIKWPDYISKTLPILDELLLLLEPKYYRDNKGVITHGSLTCDSPLCASMILSPKFRERFEDTMGAEFYVGIPNQNTIVIIPKTTQVLNELSKRVADMYEEAIHPASIEIFEISKLGIIAVGKIGES
jgi:hypothetical protein